MTWSIVALLGYLFAAISAVFDKYLLSDRIPAPAVYAFFVALFSAVPLVFSPFLLPYGLGFLDGRSTLILLLSGMFFVYSLIPFYIAVKQHEVSRVAPLVGTTVSLVAFLAVFLPWVPGEIVLGPWYIVALILLIGGGLLISFDLPLRPGEHISKLVFLAGLLMGTSLLLLKEGYVASNFVSGFVWSRTGMFLAGLSLLVFVPYRKEILGQFRGFKHRSERALSTSVLFVLNKSTGGLAALLLSYATFLGPVSFIQALSGMQYVFILAITFPLSLHFHAIFGEKLFFWDWVQKIVAVILIGAGLWLATMSGVPLLT